VLDRRRAPRAREHAPPRTPHGTAQRGGADAAARDEEVRALAHDLAMQSTITAGSWRGGGR